MAPPLPTNPSRRVQVCNAHPQVDCGRFPIRRVVGEAVAVSAHVFADGHDRIAAVVQYREVAAQSWQEVAMTATNPGEDLWTATFEVTAMGRWEYRIRAWVDHFATWRDDLVAKAAADVDVAMHLLAGVDILRAAVGRRRSADAALIRDCANLINDESTDVQRRVSVGLDEELAMAMASQDRRDNTTTSKVLQVEVDRELARFSSWYELFPRSLGDGGDHGTLRDVIDHLDYVADMGFDVLYLPPIHPIGTTKRKGRNNSIAARDGDPGSPWAIGSPDGGHKAVHPQLGTVDDLAELVAVARDRHGIEVALDIAFQCSPDHPWVTEHPEWFRKRPDGSVQYAENPPKRYEDIYPINFETSDPQGLWHELRSVISFWVDAGVTVFRVDNPHTKSFDFWEWCISGLKAEHPELVFLAEAFSRPRIMEGLAKRGFNQSYSYFTWRESKWDFEQYLGYLTDTEVAEYYRPNFWPNTPDILAPHLQFGGRNMFVQRLLLATTMSSNWGMYGPAFELMESVARPRHDEYLDNEKYQLRSWDLDREASLAPLIGKLNRVRREHEALQATRNLHLHATDSDRVLCFSKRNPAGTDTVLVVISLDTQGPQATTVHLDLAAIGLSHDDWFMVDDRLTDNRWYWQGPDNYVELHPQLPAHVFVVHRQE